MTACHDLVEGSLHAVELEFAHEVEDLGVPSDDPPEVVVAGTIGDRCMTERQCGRRHDVGRWGGFTLTGQDIENDIGGMDAVTERLGTGRFHRGQTVSQHRVEDVDHLPIAIVGAGKLAPDPLARGRQHPVFGRSTVAQAPGLRASTGT